MSLENKMLKQNLLATLFLGLGILSLGSAHSAKADVEVDAGRRSYGYILVTGTSSSVTAQGTDYSAHLTTIGSSTDDDGDFSLTLNQKEKLPAGSYRLHYSSTWVDVDIRPGQVKTLKLQKITVKNPKNVDSVTLTNEDDNEQVAEWQANTDQPTSEQSCHNQVASPLAMPMLAPLIILSDANPLNWRENCETVFKSFPSPASSAYFMVFPGKYTMTWNYTDGTNHSQEGIVVQ